MSGVEVNFLIVADACRSERTVSQGISIIGFFHQSTSVKTIRFFQDHLSIDFFQDIRFFQDHLSIDYFQTH